MYKVRSPVVLCVFNRPELTKQVLDRILSIQPELLFVVADGARSDRPDDQALCLETRAIVESARAHCEVRVNYSDINMGCKNRIATGLDWVFSQVTEAIVLEDDCLADVSFFEYCDELLKRYRDCNDIHMISGSNYLMGRKFTEASYYFSRCYHIWGWATWSRAWKDFDVRMRRWPKLRESDWVENYLPTKEMSKVARYFFNETYAGRVDTWDYQWVLSGWLNNAYAIVPTVNLVTNIGFGAQATHLHNEDDPFANLHATSMKMPMKHPEMRIVDEAADLYEFDLLYGRHAFSKRKSFRRLISWLKRTIRAFKPHREADRNG